jgi:hypothetical protein
MIARLTLQLLRPAIDHWQGLHRWPVTLFVSVIAMSYLYNSALLQLPAWPDYIAIACWVIAGCLLLAWQIVGTLRAVNANLKFPVDVSAVYGGYITAAVAVVLVGLHMLDGVTRQLPKPIPQASLSSNLFAVSLDKTTNSVVIQGEINYGSNAALVDLIKQHPEIKRVVLDSSGGGIFVARAIAGLIQRQALDTHVDRRCFSACTLVFIAGTNRTLGPEGQLGFHKYAINLGFATQTVDAVAEQKKDLQYFRQRGVKANFVDRIFKADHNSIWRPDQATLLAASVISALPQ